MAGGFGFKSVEATAYEVDEKLAPHWRCEGFYGQIRVTLEGGEDWYVTVLAPMHFLRRLAYYGEWFRRENANSGLSVCARTGR